MRLLIVLLFVCIALRPCQPKRTVRTELYVIPILWHGPNNQITEVKEALSFSHLLPESVAVVPDLLEHKFSDGGVNRMDSKELFDLRHLKKSGTRFLLLEDLLKTWNGVLDAVLFFREEEFPSVASLIKGMGLTAPHERNWLRSPISVSRGCGRSNVQRLQKVLQPYRYVGLLSYDDFALQTHKLAGTLLTNCGTDLCCKSYKERSVLLRLSPQLRQLAENFIQAAIGKDIPFIAGHIRPMPDDCVTLWESPAEELDPEEMSRTCRTDFMYNRFVPNLQALQRLYNTSTAFIMTHPLIRPRVTRMLKAGGIEPVYFGLADLNASIWVAAEPLRTPLSFSLLAMVEEAVSAAATAFLGTGESSMTGMVVQERIARGLDPSTNYYISPHLDCSVTPCTVPDYYERRRVRASGGGGPLLSRVPGF